ncbi:putative hydrolase [Actinacidiphila reveromycinica]|uniref:Putative hydrolase n=2 Tax=Actinacidiphila reveromycinica TaxID=659352 RepID=A0A7U3UP85_9ACTN|nr:putative hydrolase [Streptomyces sp. SN-593]
MPSMAVRRVVLWDVDHTLIDTGGVGRELSARAFERTTGIPMREQATIDGITEAVIFRETSKLHGLTTTRDDFEKFAEALTAAHVESSEELRARGHGLAGAAAVLDRLARTPDVTQTVVSGNVRAVAKIKLNVFGLDRHIVWECGAYGEDADERADLVRVALRRATEHLGRDLTPQDAVVIGDTPADVSAALEVGVPLIAVASGRFSAEDLRAAGASRVVSDLRDAEQIAHWVTAA